MPFLSELHKNLESMGIKVLRKSDHDIDCYTDRPLDEAAKDLETLGLVIVRRKKNLVEGLLINDDQCLPIEVTSSLFAGAAFRHFQVKKEFIESYLTDPQGHQEGFRIIRSALCLSRRHYLTNTNPETVSYALSQALDVSPYKAEPARWNYSTTFSILLHNAKISSIQDRYTTLFLNIWSNWKSSRTCAIVGPDGAGKSTIISALTGYDGIKTVYIGIRELKTLGLIRRLQKIRYLSIPFVHGLMFVEYWYKLMKTYLLRLRGYDIVFDRYPTFDYLVSPSTFDRFLGKTLYKFFFPKPQKIFMLTVPAKDIVKRKDELTIAEIEFLYQKAESLPVVKIDNTGSVSSAIIRIMKAFYKFQD